MNLPDAGNNHIALPAHAQAVLEKIRLFRFSFDDEVKSKHVIDNNSTTLVDPSPKSFSIFTKHSHYQLRNLCELNSDGEALYFSGDRVALPESQIREAELRGEKVVPSRENLLSASQRDNGVLRKLFLKTGNLCMVERVNLKTIHSISCYGGFVAVNDSSDVQIVHEATGRLVRGQFFSYKHINTVQLVPFKANPDAVQVMLLVCKNDGEISSYILEEEEDNTFVARSHQLIAAPFNINYVSYGAFEFGNYLLGVGDDARGPVVYRMSHNGLFAPLNNALCYTKITSSTMCAWQVQGPHLAVATERGQCLVWHLSSKEIVKQFGPHLTRVNDNDEPSDHDTSFTFNSESCIRLVKFNTVPLFNYILAFAETKSFVHIVDTRTWERQVIKVSDGPINGLCFSRDGKRLHVAHAEGVLVYELQLRKSLLESCVQYIHANLHLKNQFNWRLDLLPREVQRKLEY